MFVIPSVLFLFVASGFANYTSISFANYTASSFASNSTENSFANNYTASEFSNRSRIAKPYFSFSNIKQFFDNFISQYGKVYQSLTEMRERYNIFKDNLMKANQLNAKYPDATYGITEFADLKPEEYNKRFSSLSGPKNLCKRGAFRNYVVDNQEIPLSFDWRLLGVVTPVKNQGECNSCYAWSAIGNLEGQYARKYMRLYNFSAQQIIDCDTFSRGCNNGWTTNAGVYLYEIGGAMKESDYPPTRGVGKCYHNPQKFVAKVTECRQFPNVNEETLKQLLYKLGPLSVAVDSSSWNLYSGGVHGSCEKNMPINHAVLLVGFGEANGVKYWTIKNTAGPIWGEQGYIRIPRGKNACGIVNDQIMTVFVE